MGNVIKKSEVAKLYPRRDPLSHKGQNGRVLIIGGSIDYYGAPILAALGALHSGCDLVHLLVPECNFEVTRSVSPDFVVHKYSGNYLNGRTLDHIDDILGKVDCVLIGPGVTEDPEILRTITRIIQKTACSIVLDAEAIPAIAQLGLAPTDTRVIPRFLITPNRAEMNEILENPLPKDPEQEAMIIEDFAKKWNVVVMLKGHLDIIAASDKPTNMNITGNAGMTVGGSGDVLAGYTASLIAQHADPYDAALCAAFVFGENGDHLYAEQGTNFTASELALALPFTIHRLIG